MRRLVEEFLEEGLGALGLGELIESLGAGGMFAVAIALAVVGTFFAMRSQRAHLQDSEVRAAADFQANPRRAWVQGAMFILQRGWDNAYVEPEIIGPNLRAGWDIATAEQLEQQVTELLEGEGDAWGLLRAMSLTRSAVAVGWMTNEASFERCFAIGKRLQQRYPSWQAMASDALRERRAWRDLPLDGSGDDDAMQEIAESARELADSHWKSIDWQRSLDL